MFTLSPASVRTTTPTASSLTPPFSFFSSTNQFLLRSQIQRKLSRSSPIYCSSTVRKSTIITCGAITDIDESQFSSTVLKSDRPVLVEFVADWCGPCRLISPSIEWVAQVSCDPCNYNYKNKYHSYVKSKDYLFIYFCIIKINLGWELLGKMVKFQGE